MARFPFAAPVNAGASAWCQVTRRALRRASRRTAELLLRPVLPTGANLQRHKWRTRLRDARSPVRVRDSLRRLRCRVALSPPAGGLATPAGRPKTRSRMLVFVSRRAVAFLEIAPTLRTTPPSTCEVRHSTPGQKAVQAGHPLQMGAPSRVVPAEGRGTRACAQRLRTRQPPASHAPTLPGTAIDNRPTDRHRAPPPASYSMRRSSSVTSSRPSTAPTSSGTLFGGGTGSARRRGHRAPPHVGNGSEPPPRTPPTPSGSPLAASGQALPCHHKSPSGLNRGCDRPDFLISARSSYA